MPELRQNIILKDWVIISTERAKRPEQLKEDRDIRNVVIPTYDKDCPFCPGNSDEKIQPIYQEEDDNGDWLIQVIPNKYPAVIDSDKNMQSNMDGIFRWMDAVGHHELFIESPDHSLTLATMDIKTIHRVLRVYQKRYIDLMMHDNIESVILFRNHGRRAGASQQHPHSQVIAIPIIPPDIMSRMNESLRYYEEHRSCIFCKLLESELGTMERVVIESPHFVAFVPYAAKSPFHLWIYPRRHEPSFAKVNDDELKDLAAVLRGITRKLYFGLNNPDYNLIVRSTPKGYGHSRFFHWYITIVPRLTRTAGFELGSGMFINPTIPEDNAEYLRGVKE